MRKFAMKSFNTPTVALLLFATATCGGNDGKGGNGGSQTSEFVGVVSQSDGSASGSITITVQTGAPAPPAATGPNLADPVNASAVLVLGGQTSLTGAYDAQDGSLALNGGGFTFGGEYDGQVLDGFWTGPGGANGSFVTAKSANAVTFCGNYVADDESDGGTFSFVLFGTTLRGDAYSSVDQSYTPLEGVVNGNAITIYLPGTTTPVATGTRSGNDVSGTYDDGEDGIGTWSGSVCQ